MLAVIACGGKGLPDHLHILIGLHPSQAISDLVRDIKADTNEWINKKPWVRGRFSWQEGYGAFSYPGGNSIESSDTS